MNQITLAPHQPSTSLYRTCPQCMQEFAVPSESPRKKYCSWDCYQPNKIQTLDDMLMKCIPEPNSGCWLWTSLLNHKGYARTEYMGRKHQGHRLIYEWVKGVIPDGLRLDHLCRVRCCVNPDHLEPVTTAENNRRAARFRAISAQGTAEKEGK